MEKSNVFIDYDLSIKKINSIRCKSIKEYSDLIKEIMEIEDFFSHYVFLNLSSDFILLKNKKVFSIQRIITSVELTCGNLVSCCESICLADANLLLRKIRDDIFFYLYIVTYDTNKKLEIEDKYILEMECQIEKWLKNNLKDLNINFVLKSIGNLPNIKEVINKFNLKSSFNSISERLNNYAHGNGISFYNSNCNAYTDEELVQQLFSVVVDLKYIVVTFLFLLVLCNPSYVRSSDYIDYLDCGDVPPEESLYWVAPFIERIIKNNIDMIDDNCMQYLKQNTSMLFEE